MAAELAPAHTKTLLRAWRADPSFQPVQRTLETITDLQQLQSMSNCLLFQEGLDAETSIDRLYEVAVQNQDEWRAWMQGRQEQLLQRVVNDDDLEKGLKLLTMSLQ